MIEDDDATSSITEKDYVIRSPTVDRWYFYYNHGYLMRYHHKPTNTWGTEFIRYSDELVKINKMRLKQ